MIPNLIVGLLSFGIVQRDNPHNAIIKNINKNDTLRLLTRKAKKPLLRLRFSEEADMQKG